MASMRRISDYCFTEALTVIDVNSREKWSRVKVWRKLLFCVNMEAVSEIARQLRLRDVGGIIVIDLIDMQKIQIVMLYWMR